MHINTWHDISDKNKGKVDSTKQHSQVYVYIIYTYINQHQVYFNKNKQEAHYDLTFKVKIMLLWQQ